MIHSKFCNTDFLLHLLLKIISVIIRHCKTECHSLQTARAISATLWLGVTCQSGRDTELSWSKKPQLCGSG